MLTCLLIDDEPLALEVLEDDLSKIPNIRVLKKCLSAFEALDILRSEPVDLIFLDINMPDLTGLQFLKALSKRPMVIFTTAYPNYALDGFEWDAVDYLLKPISFERLLRGVNKALDLQIIYQKDPELKNAAKETAENKPKHDYFFVKADYKDAKVLFNDILYIEGLKDYVKIFIAGRPFPLITQLNLKNIEDKLPHDQFIRIHRSFIVSVSKIESIQKNRIYIADKVLPVGDFYKSKFLETVETSQVK